MAKEKKLYKFLRTGLKSNSGNHSWEMGKWYKESDISICNSGFHASKTPLQALGYVAGEILAEVSVRGDSVIQDDKECWSEMKITKAWHWKKEDSVAFSIYAAELCIQNYEKVYPNGKRPREAIEAAKKWLAEPTEENRSAAESAAWSAWSAAESAAWSARSAVSAVSAVSAAESAAWSAWSAVSAVSAVSAAESAWSAAWSAAEKKLVTSLNKWFVKRVKLLTPYE